MPEKTLTRKERVVLWLQDNPGYHRPVDIAHSLGEPTQPIAADCRKLMEQGVLDRRVDGIRGTYAAKEAASV